METIRVEIPWELRLKQFETIIVDKNTRINYWTIDGNGKVFVGFHNPRESHGEVEIGKLLSSMAGDGKTLYLLDNKYNKIVSKVLPIILKGLGENIEVLRQSSVPKKKN